MAGAVFADEEGQSPVEVEVEATDEREGEGKLAEARDALRQQGDAHQEGVAAPDGASCSTGHGGPYLVRLSGVRSGCS